MLIIIYIYRKLSHFRLLSNTKIQQIVLYLSVCQHFFVFLHKDKAKQPHIRRENS